MTRNRSRQLTIIALLVIIGVLAAIGAVLLMPDDPQTAPAPITTPTVASTSAAAPTFNENAGDADEDDQANGQDPNEAAWQPIVESFGRDFTNVTGGEAKWRTRLIGDPDQPNVTADVAKQLATVDVANVPKGRYDSYEILKNSAYESAVKVTYREGWAMVLYLITDGSKWQVYGYDKFQQ